MPLTSPKSPTLFRPEHLFKERNGSPGSEFLFSDGRNEVTLTYDIPGQTDPQPAGHPGRALRAQREPDREGAPPRARGSGAADRPR